MAEIAFIGVLIAFLASLIVVTWSHPMVRKVAVKRNIVDNPDARKLQKSPVPVMGGVAVFFGLVTGLCVMSLFMDTSSLLPVFVAMSLMLCVGVMDDVSGLSPWLRFVIEIMVVVMLIFTTDISLNHLHALWGFYNLPGWLSIPLTIVAVVGMINALNLIDGVDGLCSGYGVFASLAFAFCFLRMGDVSYAILAFAVAGAIFPFMLHNMFGERYKMFLGDGGSLVLGFICSLYVMRVIQSGYEVVSESTISLTLAVLAIPVFDTLRVMTARIIAKRSPFSPDKTHLHHMFIRLGYSHVITALNVIFLNGLVVLIWRLCNKLQLSGEVQLYVVIASGLLFTTGLYYTVEYLEKNKPQTYARLQQFAQRYTIHRVGVLLKIKNFLDK